MSMLLPAPLRLHASCQNLPDSDIGLMLMMLIGAWEGDSAADADDAHDAEVVRFLGRSQCS